MLVRIGSREHFLITFSFYRSKSYNWMFSTYRNSKRKEEREMISMKKNYKERQINKDEKIWRPSRRT